MKRAVYEFFPGEDPMVTTDTVYADDHPYVTMYPDNFTEVVVIEKPARRGRPPVEQATAAPGEERETTYRPADKRGR